MRTDPSLRRCASRWACQPRGPPSTRCGSGSGRRPPGRAASRRELERSGPGTTRSSWSAVVTSVAGYFVPLLMLCSGGVLINIGELFLVVRRTVLHGPAPADGELMVAQHIHHADGRKADGVEVRTLHSQAPTSRPPFEPPRIASLSDEVYFSAMRYSAAAMKSSKTFCLFSSMPALCHTPRRTRNRRAGWLRNRRRPAR